MTVFQDKSTKEFKRELFILGDKSEVVKLLGDELTGPLTLTSYTAAELGLKAAVKYPSDTWAAWSQQTIANSRKQVQPMVQRVLQSKY